MTPINKVGTFFIRKEGSKDVLDRKKLMLCLALVISIGTAFAVLIGPNDDTSVVINSIEPIKSEVKTNTDVVDQQSQGSQRVNGMLHASAQVDQIKTQHKRGTITQRFVKNIEYKAPQVIRRKGPGGFAKGLPLGANLVGKLLTTIDTRETGQFYKVLLPYGGNDKNGGSLPKNTIAFGKINYPKKGNKVFIQFTKALLPDGKEVKLKAQALSSKDYSPGLIGEFHGKRTERIAATLGLSMVSAMTDTLTEREALGGSSSNGTAIATEVTPKATMRNALYQGLSKVSEMEAQRQASELGSQQEYVTVPAGKEMIVNLVLTYYGE